MVKEPSDVKQLFPVHVCKIGLKGTCQRNFVPTLIKKENKTSLIYKGIQMGSDENSYMRKGFLIYDEMRKFSPYMRRPVVIYDFAPDPS
jgi:hypothetical protein